MRAVVIRAWTTPAELRVSEIARPVPGPGEVLIRQHAVPLSYSLSLLVQGKYQRKPPFPFIPGNTACGEIIECGVNVTRFQTGDRVIASLEEGALAEYVCAPLVNAYPIPDELPFKRAHAFNTSYNSVCAALTWPRLLNIQEGETLLVHGAAGGVGTAAVEIGRLLGATVIATASTPAKREWATRHGAHQAIDTHAPHLRDAVMDLTGGKGVNAVLDPVGGPLFDESIRCLAPEGRILPIGFASGSIPKLAANLVMVKNIAVLGLYMGYYKIDARVQYEAQVRAVFDQLGRWFVEGRINPETTATFPLERVAEAFARVLDRQHLGHVAVLPAGRS